ncbi:PspA/IM30 family protein [Metabacillus sp. RGM 3146]|uniref:PspA/IM30 family protein n=1 Tax=Metabacillus sp. RGM 3146 TaxID=3401092 RepID=UPI003B9BC5D3
MGNLFQRMKQNIESDLHELLDHKEKDNPIAMLNHYLRECEKEADKVKKLVERQAMLQNEFTDEYNHAMQLAAKRKHQADIAAQAGETELSEFAVKEHTIYAERAQRLEKSSKEAADNLKELEQKYEEMKHKLKDMHLRRMELMGRENAARGNHRMNKVHEGEHFMTSSFNRFSEMESYLERLEQRVSKEYYAHTIDEKISSLEKELKNQESNVNP